jgi:hypothetical protein
LLGGLEHLKIETRLIDERLPSVMVEYGTVLKRGRRTPIFLIVVYY